MIYGNDWFVAPVDVDSGSFIDLIELAYTTTFGERFIVPPADDEGRNVRSGFLKSANRVPIKPCAVFAFRRPREQPSKALRSKKFFFCATKWQTWPGPWKGRCKVRAAIRATAAMKHILHRKKLRRYRRGTGIPARDDCSAVLDSAGPDPNRWQRRIHFAERHDDGTR